jgi:hypothetical protein
MPAGQDSLTSISIYSVALATKQEAGVCLSRGGVLFLNISGLVEVLAALNPFSAV